MAMLCCKMTPPGLCEQCGGCCGGGEYAACRECMNDPAERAKISESCARCGGCPGKREPGEN